MEDMKIKLETDLYGLEKGMLFESCSYTNHGTWYRNEDFDFPEWWYKIHKSCFVEICEKCDKPVITN